MTPTNRAMSGMFAITAPTPIPPQWRRARKGPNRWQKALCRHATERPMPASKCNADTGGGAPSPQQSPRSRTRQLPGHPCIHSLASRASGGRDAADSNCTNVPRGVVSCVRVRQWCDRCKGIVEYPIETINSLMNRVTSTRQFHATRCLKGGNCWCDLVPGCGASGCARTTTNERRRSTLTSATLHLTIDTWRLFRGVELLAPVAQG
jgi:hypothetical protein